MLKNKLRIRRFQKGKKMLKSLLLKQETQLNILNHEINDVISKLNILYNCLDIENINSDLKVFFTFSKKNIQYENHIMIGNCVNEIYEFKNTKDEFERFNNQYLQNNISFIPMWENKKNIKIKKESFNYKMHYDNLLYSYNKNLWQYGLLNAEREDIIYKMNKYTNAVDNCDDIILTEQRLLRKSINNNFTNEIIIQYAGAK